MPNISTRAGYSKSNPTFSESSDDDDPALREAELMDELEVALEGQAITSDLEVQLPNRPGQDYNNMSGSTIRSEIEAKSQNVG